MLADPKLTKNILVYTRRARVARMTFCGWIIIIDYDHNLSYGEFLTYLLIPRFLQILQKFCSFLAKSDRFKRLQRTEDERRTDAHTLQSRGTPTQKALRANKS